jgi:hypothetical protein
MFIMVRSPYTILPS